MGLPVRLTVEEIAKHNSRESCWVIIQGRTYDLTEFLDEHPGGAGTILRYAGKVSRPLDRRGYVYIQEVNLNRMLPKNMSLYTRLEQSRMSFLPVSFAHRDRTQPWLILLDKHLGKAEISSSPALKSSAVEMLNIQSPKTTIPLELCFCLHDFELAAKAVLNERAWTYFSSAAEDLRSYHINIKDWSRIHFRPRILRNVQSVDTRQNILGFFSNLPIFIAPAALARLGHPDGELCLVRAAAQCNIPYAVSSASSVSTEELSRDLRNEAAGGMLFYQLYVRRKRSETLALIQRVREQGFKALLVTVDTPVVGKRDEDDRYKARVLLETGTPIPSPVTAPGPNSEPQVLRGPYSSTLDWEDLKWIRQAWGDSGPICLKGIATAEDAKMAMDYGYRHIYLSNHGGRQLDSSTSALRTLLEIRHFCPEVLTQCEIIIDGGARRGTDVLKALSLGARAVGFGRPMMYALSAHGTKGVIKAIDRKLQTHFVFHKLNCFTVLKEELETSMRLLGVTSLKDLQPQLINTRELDPLIIQDSPHFPLDKSRI